MAKRTKRAVPVVSLSRRHTVGSLRGRRTLRAIVCLGIIALILLAATAIAEDVNYQYAQIATQKGPLNMRKTASSKADIIEKIPKGAIVEVTPVDDTWCACTYNGRQGYIMTKYLAFMDMSQFRALSAGDSGQDVSALKEKLQALYYLDGDKATGDVYDADTEAAVRLLQAKNGAGETGTATPALQALLLWGSPKNNLPSKLMTVTISSKCAGYNHVGENWSKYFSINGQSASSGDKAEIVLGQRLPIYTKLTESDASPDVGSAKEDVEITQAFFDSGFTITQTVTVKENKGRYSGNKATWTITYTFVP